MLGGQRLFDNFYWIGNTGIGAWLITSNDGYILFDTMNSEEDARDIIIPAIKKLNLDPMKIKYLVFGHNHFDHTGGGEYIQRMTGAKAVMHRDDWEIYLKSTGRGGGGAAAAVAAPTPGATPAPPPRPPPAPAAPLPKMKRDIDATDGMTLNVGDVTAHDLHDDRPHAGIDRHGRAGEVSGPPAPDPARDRRHRRQQPRRRSSAATSTSGTRRIKMKVENVMQAHPNTNMNLLARTKYVHDNYPPAKNPLLYGADAHRALHQHHAELHAGADGDSRLVRRPCAAPDQDRARRRPSRDSRDGAAGARTGEALVRVGPSGLCGTDLLLYDGVYRGRNRPVPSPLIVGHEASGEVVELGPGTRWPGAGHARRHRGGDGLRRTAFTACAGTTTCARTGTTSG